MSETVEVPMCSKCDRAMIWSFALRGCEYVCPRCLTGAGMFNGQPKIEITKKWHDTKRRLYKMKLHYVALTKGGGSCRHCGTSRTCNYCKPAFEKYGREPND